jgi:hypothetical protein
MPCCCSAERRVLLCNAVPLFLRGNDLRNAFLKPCHCISARPINDMFAAAVAQPARWTGAAIAPSLPHAIALASSALGRTQRCSSGPLGPTIQQLLRVAARWTPHQHRRRPSARHQHRRRRRTMASAGIWVFGYGSLVHRPGFEYSRRVEGFIRGYRRVFHQGSTDHRGTQERPGRTVTLVPCATSTVVGREGGGERGRGRGRGGAIGPPRGRRGPRATAAPPVRPGAGSPCCCACLSMAQAAWMVVDVCAPAPGITCQPSAAAVGRCLPPGWGPPAAGGDAQGGLLGPAAGGEGRGWEGCGLGAAAAAAPGAAQGASLRPAPAAALQRPLHRLRLPLRLAPPLPLRPPTPRTHTAHTPHTAHAPRTPARTAVPRVAREAVRRAAAR